MSRVTRMALGLITMFLILGAAGGVAAALGAGGETAGWIALGVGLAWIIAASWWTMRAPPARSDEASARYWAALRHARHPSADHPSRHHSDRAA